MVEAPLTASGRPGPPTTDSEETREAAYETVSLRETWGVLSIFTFIASLGTGQILRLLPWRLRGYDMIPPLAVTLVPVLTGLGLLFALLGRRRGLARIGLWANGLAFGLGMTLVLLILIWRSTQGR